MAISSAEWWMGVAAPARQEISVPDRLKQTVELVAASIAGAIGQLANPPYPTPNGKPLKFTHYPPGEGKLIMTAEEFQKLL